MTATLRLAVLALVLSAVTAAKPALAQWTRVNEIPPTTIFSVWANGDTITAGADTVIYVSTDAGATWKPSAKPAPDVTIIDAVRMRNGRLYAGTQSKGVFISDDLGATWVDFNQGLVGGFADSQLLVVDLLIRGDSLYAATAGAGAWVRNLTSGTWGRFGDFEAFEAPSMQAIAAGGSRLLASAGFNGQVFFRDPGQPDWTESLLENDRFAPGLAPLTAIWTGRSWVAGTNIGVFISALGQSPWTFVDVGVRGPLLTATFALRGHELLGSFMNGSTAIEISRDDGATWQVLDTLPGIVTVNIATAGDVLYAARFPDGLWRRRLPPEAAEPPSAALQFGIRSAQPIREAARFSFDLPEPGRVTIDVFDVAGRHASRALDASMSAGPHEVPWSAGDMASGVYFARLSVGERTEAIRLVRVR
ncbi:MAG TPA: hypothetical protein VF363_03400 [Candidatus Eisenbacteria bacterium]